MQLVLYVSCRVTGSRGQAKARGKDVFGGYVIYHEPVSLRPFKVLPAGLKKKIKEKLLPRLA